MDRGKQTVFRVVAKGKTTEETIENCMRTYGKTLRLVMFLSYNNVAFWEHRLRINEYLDQLTNEYIPKHLKGKGHSRLNSIYAYPAFPHHRQRLLNDPTKVIVELKVDPAQAIVSSELHVTELYESTPGGHAPEYIRWAFTTLPRIYWSSIMSLEDFLMNYENPVPEEYDKLQKSTPKVLPWRVGNWKAKDCHGEILEAEVLIPEREIGNLELVKIIS